ncbi:hypothetical protein SAMN05519104_6684 [Rhizobiales bacterium GAS188]|nr:hypothetical protein SAMN05519104_6684 [Rhizobiales bacterium GAS188]
MKTIDVKDFLRWVFRDELPKGAASELAIKNMVRGWDAVSRQGELMTETIDDGRPINSFGVVSIVGGYVQQAPHEDALICHDAIGEMDRASVEWTADWNPLAEYGDLAGLQFEVASRVRERLFVRTGDGSILKGGFASLLRRWAILGAAPDWVIDEAPRLEYVRNARASAPAWFVLVRVPNATGVDWEVEADGWDQRGKRPKKGAYRKQHLVPDPILACEARAEYELWTNALRMLVETLNGKLTEHRLTMDVCERPWIDGADAAKRPRVLASLIDGESYWQPVLKPARGKDRSK